MTTELQGEEEAIDKVIQSIESERYVRIQNMNVTPLYQKVSSGSYTEWHNGIPYGMPVCRVLISGINHIQANPAAPTGTGFLIS